MIKSRFDVCAWPAVPQQAVSASRPGLSYAALVWSAIVYRQHFKIRERHRQLTHE